jgi:hypothetical protein
LCCSPDYAAPTDSFLADGCLGFGQLVVFDRAQGLRRLGTVIVS